MLTRRRSPIASTTSRCSPALVEDEGNTYRGIAEIRQWRSSTPLVSYEITSIEPKSDNSVVVTCTVSGDIPGSPVAGFRFGFEDLDDNAIRVLRIKPRRPSPRAARRAAASLVPVSAICARSVLPLVHRGSGRGPSPTPAPLASAIGQMKFSWPSQTGRDSTPAINLLGSERLGRCFRAQRDPADSMCSTRRCALGAGPNRSLSHR
jgi:hypothetical protein